MRGFCVLHLKGLEKDFASLADSEGQKCDSNPASAEIAWEVSLLQHIKNEVIRQDEQLSVSKHF